MYKGFGIGAEGGYAHWGRGAAQAWIGSGDVSYHLAPNAARGQVDPFVLVGAAGYFPTSVGVGAPAGNFGGVSIWLRERAALCLEVRDHVNANWDGPGNHYISFPVGVTFR